MTEIPKEIKRAAEQACKPSPEQASKLFNHELITRTLEGAVVGGGTGAAAGAIIGPGAAVTGAIGAAGGALLGAAAGLVFGVQDANRPDPHCVEEHLRPLQTPKVEGPPQREK